MRNLILIVLGSLVLCLPSLAQETAQAEQERTPQAQELIDRGLIPANYKELLPPDSLALNVHYSARHTYQVQISSAEGDVSTLSVPRGTYLNIQADPAANPGSQTPITESENVFYGDIVLRTRRVDEVREDEPSAAFAVMANAPTKMVFRDAVVQVQRASEE